MRRNKEAGQALVLVAAGMVFLIGIAGLGVDMGVLRYEKRIQQTAADAAAIAGANNLASSSGGVIAGGWAASATNGFTDNAGGALSSCTASGATVGTVCVQISDPASGPSTGPHKNNPNYVEAYVSEVHDTYFMKIFGATKQVVTARAVATSVSGASSGGGCLYTLGAPNASIQGVAINGSAILNAPTCGINDNGNYDPTGGALTVNAGTFGVSGGCSGSGCGKTGKEVTCADQSSTDCPAYSAPASGDPLARLTPPCSPCTGGSLVKPSGGTVSPGTYSEIRITGNGTVTFNPGIYVIDGSGGVNCTGNANINGTGVMFYFTGGATWSCTGTGVMNLTAPSPSNCPVCASQYDGILMYQDPGDTNGPSLGGNNGSFFDGALYFPSSQVTFFGNNKSISVAIVVADAFALSGNPTVNLQGTAGLPPGVSILTNAVLVE
jgi:hypothetical protein